MVICLSALFHEYIHKIFRYSRQSTYGNITNLYFCITNYKKWKHETSIYYKSLVLYDKIIKINMVIINLVICMTNIILF